MHIERTTRACLFGIVVLIVTGCTPDPRQIRAERDRRLQEIAESCQGLGFQPDTPAFNDCKLKLYQSYLERDKYRYAPYPYYGGYPYFNSRYWYGW